MWSFLRDLLNSVTKKIVHTIGYRTPKHNHVFLERGFEGHQPTLQKILHYFI